ncbi:MAG TPA: L,D-transpeptidase family protein [Stellaceae bacterium]|nr:L,D-transpeptidase family protein [Stellaceae bacterium]
MILRRTILAALAAPPSPVFAMSFADLVYDKGTLSWPGGSARAACGKAGVTVDKREGDHASPAGTFPLLRAFYRPDRLAAPKTTLPLAALTPNDGWCDDPADANYNRFVALPYPASHEDLWRADGLYDVIVEIGYNTDPVVPGKGSAIFLHCAAPDFAGTEGCIAVAREVLAPLLGLLGPGSIITIKA